ncbi:MAG TPA: GNAT family N-acetyltransferase [Gemmatimonadaceae bacterium]|nr:GNAT family N-acetyltransferase [Gemmatimonadaceae bacterium]
MTDVRVELEERPRADDARVVTEGLLEFNRAVIGDPNEVELAVFVRDAEGRVIGGLLGHVRWQWVYVAKLWLPDVLRGRGVGTRVMAAVEDYARRHECLGIYLDTFEYQALPFYEKLGYVQFGVLEGYPPGYRQFHLVKAIRNEE